MTNDRKAKLGYRTMHQDPLTARHGTGLLQEKRNTHQTLSSRFTDADYAIPTGV